jgi:carbon monoxide dehydrogenase subunit G
MISKEISVFVARPMEEVFDFMNDFSRVHEWQEDVVRAEVHGDWAVGTTGVFVQKLMGRELESGFEVTAYDPPYELCVRSTSGPVTFEGWQRCEEQEGGTLVTQTIEAEVGGFFKVAEGIVGNQLESSFQRDFDNMKAMLEG